MTTAQVLAESARHDGEVAWIHGYAGPLGRNACWSPGAGDCPDDVCCGDCESRFFLLPERYVDPFAGVGIHTFWSESEAYPSPRCDGSYCHTFCAPLGTGTEVYVYGRIHARPPSDYIALFAEGQPCVVGASPAPGTYRIIVRRMDWGRCPGGSSALGLEGTLGFRVEGGAARAQLYLDVESEIAPVLEGSFDGTTLALHETTLCDPCSCLFDIEATFPDSGHVVGTVYQERGCSCRTAYVFEGRKTSDEAVPFPDA